MPNNLIYWGPNPQNLCLFHRHLDDGEPLVGVLLIPDAVNVNGTGCIGNLVALLFQIGEELDIVVIEFLIRAEDLQAGSQRHGRDVLELDESGVSAFLCHLLTVLDVDVLRLVAEVLKGRDHGTMAGHRDGRKRFKVDFFHFVQFLLGSHHRLEHPFPLLEHGQLILTFPDLLLQRFHCREMLIIVPQVTDLLQ